MSKDISNWWSDCYGECPRMFYPALAAVPEWAPPGENHILYSETVLKDVTYAAGKIQYAAAEESGTEYVRLAFRPTHLTLDGANLSLRSELDAQGYTLRNLGKGDFAVTIRRIRAGEVVIR